jgi:hypothetical protein
VRFHPERFKRIFPQLREYLTNLLPQHVATYDSFVKRLGPDCVYARAALKVLWVEATERDGERFEQSLRSRGYA